MASSGRPPLKAGEGMAGLSRATERKATRALETAVGGRAALVRALSQVQRNTAAEILHAFLADPRNDKTALTDLCRKANVSVPDLWSMFKQGTFTEAQVVALAKVANGLPAVAADVMARSVEHKVRCPECHGRGKVGLPRPGKPALQCRLCHGKKTVPQVPELKRQELALEIGGLLKRDKAGVHVQVTQEAALQVAHVEQSYTDFQRETDAILFERPRVAAAPIATDEVKDGDVSS